MSEDKPEDTGSPWPYTLVLLAFIALLAWVAWLVLG